MKKVYKILIEHLTNERLDRAASRDNDYRTINKELDKALKQYDKLKLPEKDAEVIDEAFELYAAQCARYAFCAYRLGMKDAVQLLKEMGAIGK